MMHALSDQGLSVQNGDIFYNSTYLGKLDIGELITWDGRTFESRDVDRLDYNPNLDRLTLFLKDDRYEVVTGRVFNSMEPSWDRMEVKEYVGPRSAMEFTPQLTPRKAPATIYELTEIFEELFPNTDNDLYFDVLKENIILNTDMVNFPTDSGKGEMVPINDVLHSMYYLQMESRLVELGFMGKPPAYPIRDHVLHIKAGKRRRNLFLEWVQSHEWDGVPRLRRWFIDTMGARAPIFEDEKLERKYLEDVTEAWFVGAIRRQFMPTKHEIVPILISTQGIGKGQALKYTAGQDQWYIESSESVSDLKPFLDSIRGSVIVELSESKQLLSDNNEALKSFISKTSDRFRKPYARNEEDVQRRFVLIATSNKTQIFTDETGNRRYFPMFCDGYNSNMRMFSEDRIIGQYDVEQLWAEALELYRNNAKWWISKDTMELAALMQEFCTVETQDLDVIDRYLDNPSNGYTQIGARVSKDIIMREVFNMDPAQRVPPDMEESYNKWASKTGGAWKRIGTCRIRGRVTRGFERIEPPGNIPEVHRLNIVEAEDITNSQGEYILEKFRTCAMEEGFVEPDSVVMSERLSKEDLNILCRAGMIRQDEYGTMRVVNVP